MFRFRLILAVVIAVAVGAHTGCLPLPHPMTNQSVAMSCSGDDCGHSSAPVHANDDCAAHCLRAAENARQAIVPTDGDCPARDAFLSDFYRLVIVRTQTTSEVGHDTAFSLRLIAGLAMRC